VKDFLVKKGHGRKKKADDDWVGDLIGLGIGLMAIHFLGKLAEGLNNQSGDVYCPRCKERIGKWARMCPNCRFILSWL